MKRVEKKRRSPIARVFTWVGGIALGLVLSLLAYVGYQYVSLETGLDRSSAIKDAHGGEEARLDGDVNMLIMGLDSRLDKHGKELPKHIYEAMHTGNATIGGMNTNVLMWLHIPADGRRATLIQIPRDNHVEFPGCPNRVCKGKIKESYGQAFSAKADQLAKKSGMSVEEKHKAARDAGRAQQIKTVEKFMGNGLRVNHFVEVTMVAFYETAQAVQPVTVCLKKDTKDKYSGADFKAGKQQISAEQAVAFVRQRRDALGDLEFSDLDRERRQQAFMSSLAYQLKQKGTFTNPATLNGLIGVATKNISVDESLNLIDFAGKAKQIAEGKITFYTLPIEAYFKDEHGGDANKVTLPKIHATVKSLLEPPPPPTSAAPAPTATSSAPKPTVSVLNGSGVDGAAGHIINALVAEGYGKGQTSTATAGRPKTVVEYGAGQQGAAAEIAAKLGSGVTTKEAADLGATGVRVVIGTGYQVPASMKKAPGSAAPKAQTPSVAPIAPKTVGAGGKGEDTSTGSLTAISGGGIPCVK